MPLIGGFGCLELVLYGIRVLVEQFLNPNLDIVLRRLALKLLLMFQVPPAVPPADGGRRVCDSVQASVMTPSDIIIRYLLLLTLFL